MTNSVDRSITEKTAMSYTNTFISDLMHSNGKFLTLEEFKIHLKFALFSILLLPFLRI